MALEGRHFASRVSSSILQALGLSELITHSLEEYRSLARLLADDEQRLVRIKTLIERNRRTAPLFDTKYFVVSLETALNEIWTIYVSGEAPRPIEVRHPPL